MEQKLISAIDTCIDLENVGILLRTAAGPMNSGFGPEEANLLSGQIENFELDEQQEWEFQTVSNSRSNRIKILAFRDDITSLGFIVEVTDPELARRLQTELVRLYPELEM